MCFMLGTYFQLVLLIFDHDGHIVRYGRETDAKARPFAQLAFHGYRAAELRHDLFDDDQSETSSASAIFRCVERIENVTQYFRRHSGSTVDEVDDDSLRFAVPARERSANLNLAAFRHRVQTVIDEIEEELLQTIR